MKGKLRITAALAAALLLAGAYAPSASADEGDGLRLCADGALRYYEGGVPVYAGVVEDGGRYYYVNSSLKAVTGRTYSISAAKTNGLIPAGTYEAAEDGTLTPLQGLRRGDDGALRCYVGGVPVYAGIVFDDSGYMYYINSAGTAVTSRDYCVSKDNGYDLSGMTLHFDSLGRAYVCRSFPGMATYYVKDDTSPFGLWVREAIFR